MKKKKENNNKKNINNYNSKKEDVQKEDVVPKEIGTFHGFLVYEKEDKEPKENFFSKKSEDKNIFPKEEMILQSNYKKTKSRFADLFQEIMENDRKASLQEQQNLNKSNNINNNFNSINTINDDNKDEKTQNNNIINYNNSINNNNIIDNISENISENININRINLESIKDVEDDLTYSNSKIFFKNEINTSKNININYNNQTKEEKEKNISFSSNLSSKNTLYSNNSGNTGNSTNDSEYNISFQSQNVSENNSINEKNSQLIVDIKKIIFLEDKRTSIMIKNIPNKFTGELLLNIINQNFKNAYNIFILPADNNKNKNYGYAFINFVSSYFIPYFYSLFDGKMWSKTNSKKICEITYSKIQGRKNLMTHYPGKIVYHNENLKYNSEQKYIIPNEYKILFNQAFPNVNIEKHKYYFVAKLPKKNK
jgi:hypothetical protein